MSERARKNATVLVIDDSELVREWLVAVLEDEGWRVHTRAKAFLEADDVRGMAPDVVLLDLGLPDLNDSDLPFVVRSLRTSGARHVLLHSGRFEDELREMAGVAGADGFVCKAGKDEDLLAVLDRYRP